MSSLIRPKEMLEFSSMYLRISETLKRFRDEYFQEISDKIGQSPNRFEKLLHISLEDAGHIKVVYQLDSHPLPYNEVLPLSFFTDEEVYSQTLQEKIDQRVKRHYENKEVKLQYDLEYYNKLRKRLIDNDMIPECPCSEKYNRM